MRSRIVMLALVGSTAWMLGSPRAAAQATATPDTGEQMHALSPERLDLLDKNGWFSPEFKKAVRDLVTTQNAVAGAKDEEKKLSAMLPALLKQADAAEAKTAAIRADAAQYDHPEETDYALLQGMMLDGKSKLEDQLVLAQAYVWAYPSSPHVSDAAQILATLQKKQADAVQAAKDLAVTEAAERAELIKRAQAHQLSLTEWRDFLRGMSQEDLLKYIGRPTSQQDGYWVYAGEWTEDPATKERVGLQINFDAGRVLSVAELPR